MRTLLNLAITGVILWIASSLFPATVQIDSIKTLALATFLIWIISSMIAFLCAFMAVIGMAFEKWVWVILSVIFIFFSEVIAMTILSNDLGGFMIVGFWPKVLLSICFSIMHLSAPSDD